MPVVIATYMKTRYRRRAAKKLKSLLLKLNQQVPQNHLHLLALIMAGKSIRVQEAVNTILIQMGIKLISKKSSMRSWFIIGFAALLSSMVFSQPIRTTTLSGTKLYCWPDTNADVHCTFDEGASISVTTFINDFWRVKFPGIDLRYYVLDDKLVQIPIMDLIKNDSSNEYYDQEEKNYFDQLIIRKAKAKEKRKVDSILAIQKHKSDSILQSKILLAKSRKIPLYLHAASVTLNSIGNPEASIIVANISYDTIDAYKIAIHCYNNFGEQVIHYSKGTNVFTGISQDQLYPSSVIDYPDTWTLYGHENTRKIKVYLINVHFTNGKTWMCPNSSWTMVEGKYQ